MRRDWSGGDLLGNPSATAGTHPAVLFLIALVMVFALVWENVQYRTTPDAAGRTFEGCAFEVAGFAWFCS